MPNVGPAFARDLQRLGIAGVDGLKGQEPLTLYLRLCSLSGERHDPCVLDVMMSLVAFADGDEPRPWWHYTPLRKAQFGDI